MYNKGIEKHVPYYKVREKGNQEWLNANCYKTKRKRDEKWKKAKKRQMQENRNEYKLTRNECQNKKRK